MTEDSKFIWRDPDRSGGRACLIGTNFTVARLIAELADGRSIKKVARDFGLADGLIVGALREVAMAYEVEPTRAAR